MDHLRRLQETDCPGLAASSSTGAIGSTPFSRFSQNAVGCFFISPSIESISAPRLPAATMASKARIGGQIGPADRGHQLAPELVGHAQDEDPAVRGRKGLHRRHRKMRTARLLPRRDEALVEIPGRDIAELMPSATSEQAGVVRRSPCRSTAPGARPTNRPTAIVRPVVWSIIEGRADAGRADHWARRSDSIRPDSACIR